jgi:selenide,water dikinase
VVDAGVKLTDWTTCGGCAAKWPGAPLGELIASLASPLVVPHGSEPRDPGSLVVGLSPFDDAAVYRIGDDLALVSTVDFFPPLVDDPADFGAIAAANACSDVFAMGGRVALALNLAAFPEELPHEAIAAIFTSAASTVHDAGGVVAGGHTIRNPEPVFGLAVQGFVDPSRVLTKIGAQPGDRLVLSKPVGTGLVLAGADPPARAAAIAGMRELNRHAAEALVALGPAVHAVTDVTGFGLAGHAWEIAERSGVSVCIDVESVPLYPGADTAAEAGIRTGGHERNRRYVGDHVTVGRGVGPGDEAICFDPQTSGGLLAAVDESVVSACLDAGFFEIGSVEPAPSIGPMIELA